MERELVFLLECVPGEVNMPQQMVLYPGPYKQHEMESASLENKVYKVGRGEVVGT